MITEYERVVAENQRLQECLAEANRETELARMGEDNLKEVKAAAAIVLADRDRLKHDLELANRQVYIIQNGLSSAIRLKNIEIAELEKKYAFSQYNYAAALMKLADIKLAKAKAESQCPSS